MPSIQAVVSPRRPRRCTQRTRASVRLRSRTLAAVPSGESSSTNITSQRTPASVSASSEIKGSTFSRSLKVGTMTASSTSGAAVAAASPFPATSLNTFTGNFPSCLFACMISPAEVPAAVSLVKQDGGFAGIMVNFLARHIAGGRYPIEKMRKWRRSPRTCKEAFTCWPTRYADAQARLHAAVAQQPQQVGLWSVPRSPPWGRNPRAPDA